MLDPSITNHDRLAAPPPPPNPPSSLPPLGQSPLPPSIGAPPSGNAANPSNPTSPLGRKAKLVERIVETPPPPLPAGLSSAYSAPGQPLRPLPVGPNGLLLPILLPGSSKLKVSDEDLDDEDRDPWDLAKRFGPPWMLSMIVHALILLGLAVWWTETIRHNEQPLEIDVWAEDIGEQLLDNSVGLAASDPVPELTKSTLALSELPPVADPLSAPAKESFLPSGTSMSSNIALPAIGNALAGREQGSREALLAAFGGTRSTQEAVEMALLWLKRNQLRDGSWSLQGPFANGAILENRTAATAMALLAFQGAGHTHKSGQHQKVVARAWEALLRQQTSDGLFTTTESSAQQLLYAHGQATIAVCEIYGMTKDQKFKEPAERAIRYCVKNQSPEGGWRYTPGLDADTSVTGWFVMALQSAKMAGLEVPPATLERVGKFLDSVAYEGGSKYRYNLSDPSVRPSMSAEGLLCRQYLGWQREDPRLAKGVAFLLENPIVTGDNGNVYYWYYATQVLHHMEGDPWKKWNAVMRQAIPTAQIKTGAEAGSWNPEGDAWGPQGGRLYATCLSTYMLEVYYRHLPIYSNLYAPLAQ